MFADIIPPVDKSMLEMELTPDKLVKLTNNGGNHIYIVSAHDAPYTLREIGRLREITFRDAGGGTGLDCDLDSFDIMPDPFLQLIVWNPVHREIVGGYRFIHGKQIGFDDQNRPQSPTAEIFNFSDLFIRTYLPVTIELGRSWVQPEYQPMNNFRKGLYSLDNLWDGLGALIVRYPDIEYFFGKITMYTSYNVTARDLILGFMHYYFPDHDELVTPFSSLRILPETPYEQLFQLFHGQPFDAGYKLLVKMVREYNETIPPLVNAYMNLTSTMKTFGTASNPHFGDVEETGILIRIPDIYPEKKERHIKP